MAKKIVRKYNRKQGRSNKIMVRDKASGKKVTRVLST